MERANPDEFEAQFNDTKTHLTCTHAGQSVGRIDLDLSKAPASIYIEMIKVDEREQYRGRTVSFWLMCQVYQTWPDAAIYGGPLSQDDPHGPSFRLAWWDSSGTPFHEFRCHFEAECDCRGRLEAEAARLRAAYESDVLAQSE